MEKENIPCYIFIPLNSRMWKIQLKLPGLFFFFFFIAVKFKIGQDSQNRILIFHKNRVNMWKLPYGVGRRRNKNPRNQTEKLIEFFFFVLCFFRIFPPRPLKGFFWENNLELRGKKILARVRFWWIAVFLKRINIQGKKAIYLNIQK